MSQDTAFADALREGPVCVYKLRLLPYSLGHEGVLLSERNSFLTEAPVDFSKLPLWKRLNALDRATKVCSNFQRKRFPRLRERFLRFRRRGFKLEDHDRACVEFFHYLNAGRCVPRLSRRRLESGERPGRAFGAPLLAQVHQFVMTLPEIQKIANPQEMVNAAWDYPFGVAIWRYFVSMEMTGAVQIENDEEEKSRLEGEKVKNDYDEACAAWKSASTDADRTAALLKYPKLRDFAATEDEVRAWELKGAA